LLPGPQAANTSGTRAATKIGLSLIRFPLTLGERLDAVQLNLSEDG
jgi:hypothetical protein